MSDALLKKCENIMSFAPKSVVDGFARKQLAKNLNKYRSTANFILADVHYKIDGKAYFFLLDALHKIKKWDEIEITFYRPNTEIIWEYDTPTKVIKLNSQGAGALMLYPINPFSLSQWNPDLEPKIEPAMFRCYLAHFYSPESIKTHADKVDEKPLRPPRTLCSPKALWDDIRKKGIVPFELTICAYTQKNRYRYQLDVLDNKLIMDFRNQKIPIANRVIRHPIDYNHLDKILSTQELPNLAKKVLTIFFELEDADAPDIHIGLGITEKMAQNNISALYKRGLLEAKGKPPKARYEINLGVMRDVADKLGD